MICISNLDFAPLLFAVGYLIARESIAECPPECLVVQEFSASATFILCLKRGLTSMQAQCKISVECLNFSISSRMSDRDPDFLSRGTYVMNTSPSPQVFTPGSRQDRSTGSVTITPVVFRRSLPKRRVKISHCVGSHPKGARGQ